MSAGCLVRFATPFWTTTGHSSSALSASSASVLTVRIETLGLRRVVRATVFEVADSGGSIWKIDVNELPLGPANLPDCEDYSVSMGAKAIKS